MHNEYTIYYYNLFYSNDYYLYITILSNKFNVIRL